MSRGSKFKDGIRIAAAIYLIYLAVEIIRDGIIGGGMTGTGYYVGIVASIVFIVVGAAIAIYSVKSILKATAEEEKTKQIEEQTGVNTEEAAESDMAESDTAEKTAAAPESDGGDSAEVDAAAEEPEA